MGLSHPTSCKTRLKNRPTSVLWGAHGRCGGRQWRPEAAGADPSSIYLEQAPVRYLLVPLSANMGLSTQWIPRICGCVNPSPSFRRLSDRYLTPSLQPHPAPCLSPSHPTRVAAPCTRCVPRVRGVEADLIQEFPPVLSDNREQKT